MKYTSVQRLHNISVYNNCVEINSVLNNSVRFCGITTSLSNTRLNIYMGFSLCVHMNGKYHCNLIRLVEMVKIIVLTLIHCGMKDISIGRVFLRMFCNHS